MTVFSGNDGFFWHCYWGEKVGTFYHCYGKGGGKTQYLNIFIYVYGIHMYIYIYIFSPNQTYGVYMIFFLTAFSWHLYNCWMPEVMDKGLRYYWHQKWDPWWTSLAASDKNQLSWTGWASWASWASWVEGSLCKAHEQDHPKIRWTFVTINALRERFSWWHLQKLTTRGDLIRKGWNRFEATEFHVFWFWMFWMVLGHEGTCRFPTEIRDMYYTTVIFFELSAQKMGNTARISFQGLEHL